MIGGYEYWAREGFRIEAGGKLFRHNVDSLTALSALTKMDLSQAIS